MRTSTLNWSTSINNNKAARRLEHRVRLQKPAGQHKLLSEAGEEKKKPRRFIFVAVKLCSSLWDESANTPKTEESCFKIR